MKTLSKHFASIIMALLVVATIIPATVFADEAKNPATAETVETIEESPTPDKLHYAGENGYPVLVETGEEFNFQFLGVIKENGWRYTWYTSTQLPHWQMGEWYECDDGFWRTADGYIVVASQHHEKGEIVDTPFGKGMVLDYCGTKNNLDLYTHW